MKTTTILNEPFYDGQEVMVQPKILPPQYCVIDGQDIIYDSYLRKNKVYISFNTCYHKSRTPNILSFFLATSTGKGFYSFYDSY